MPRSTSSYYRGAHGIIVVYDITDRNSFNDVQKWMSEIDKFAGGNVVKLLIGNKCDVTDGRQISYEEGEALAKKLGTNFIETSAKAATNVEKSFWRLTTDIKAKNGTLYSASSPISMRVGPLTRAAVPQGGPPRR